MLSVQSVAEATVCVPEHCTNNRHATPHTAARRRRSADDEAWTRSWRAADARADLPIVLDECCAGCAVAGRAACLWRKGGVQRRESNPAMQKQRAGPAASAWRLPSFAAICRLEQRAEAAQERRVVYLIVCGCEATASLCRAWLSTGASALAAAGASGVAEGSAERARRAQTTLRERV